ncbi:hypothetical protein CMT52_17485 [Elizabethkingia anophelis]|nr:hypothetical protein [Elizabethkingia anophelis]
MIVQQYKIKTMAGQNINIGTFSWDTNKIENQIAANRMEMQKYGSMVKVAKDAVKDASKEISELEKRIESETKKQERLNDQLEKGYISQDRYNSEIEKSNEVLDELVNEQIKLSKVQAEHLIIVNKSEQAIKDLRLENNELNKLLSAGRTELSENESAYRNLNKELNALKTEAKNLGAQMAILEKEGKEGTDEYKKLAVQFAETSKKADDLNNRFKEIDKSVGDNQRTVGDYREQIKGAFSDLVEGLSLMKNGDIIGGFEIIKNGFKGIALEGRAMMAAFLSNPIGIILAVISGIALGVNEIIKYNEQLYEANKLTQQITKLQGDMLDKVTIKSQTLEEVLGLDRRETLESAGALVNEFGITYEEALQRIEDGAIKGGVANQEYLDSIREYPTFFAKAGFSAKEFIDIINAGYDLKIYKDKLPDAIKEFDLSMREQSKSTRDALVNAFGATFSDDLLKRVSQGKTTVKDALIEINKEAEKYNLTQKQQAQLTADIFRGAGEDVGGFAKLMDVITVAMIKQGGELTETQKIVKQQIESYNELGEAKNNALKSDEVLALKREFELFWTSLKTGFYNFLTYLRVFDRELDASANYINGVFKAIPKAAANAFKGVVDALSELLRNLKSGGGAIAAFFKGDFDTARAEADKFLGSQARFASRLAQIGNNFGSEINKAGIKQANDFRKQYDERTKAYAQAQRIIEQRREDANKPTNKFDGTADKPKSPAKKKIDNSAQKALEAEAKKEVEIAKMRAEQSSDIAKNELAEYILNNAKKFESEKNLTKDKIKLQNEYLDEVLKKNKQILDIEKKGKLDVVDQKIKEVESKGKLSGAELNQVKALQDSKAIIEKEYSIKSGQMEQETAEKKTEINKKYDERIAEQRKLSQAIEFQQRLLNLEKNHATEYEIQTEQENQRFQQELTNWAKENEIKLNLDNDNYISKQEIQAERDALQESLDIAKDDAEKERIQNKLNSLDFMVAQSAENQKKIEEAKEQSKRADAANTFGQVSQLVGQETTLGKAAAIAEVTMNGINAVQSAYATAQKSPITVFFPAYPLVQAGIAAAFSAKQAAKIAGFADGGLVSDGFEISRSNGDNRLVTVKDGEVILNEDQQAALGGASIFKMIGVPGFATGGVVGKVSNLTTVQQSIGTGQDYSMMAEVLREAVSEGSYNGTQLGSQQGIGEMADSRKISTQSGF